MSVSRSCTGVADFRPVVKTYQQVWAIRFIQGFFEASTFSGTHYLLGCWYKDEELGKRTAVFTSAAQFGTLFSGVMQGGIISTLAGKSGLTGWQWLFVIDFCSELLPGCTSAMTDALSYKCVFIGL